MLSASNQPPSDPSASFPVDALAKKLPATKIASFCCDLKSARDACTLLRDFIAGYGLSDDQLFACELALVEGCNNAVQFAPEHRRHDDLTAEVTVHADRVELRVNDRTDGFDLPARIPPPEPAIDHGRGLFLVQSLMDTVRYERGTSGNTLVMIKGR